MIRSRTPRRIGLNEKAIRGPERVSKGFRRSETGFQPMIRSNCTEYLAPERHISGVGSPASKRPKCMRAATGNLHEYHECGESGERRAETEAQ